MTDVNPFKTSDYGLAAYLAYNGVLFLGSEPTGSYRRNFVFVESPECERFVEEWMHYEGDAETCRVYFKYINEVKRSLKNEEMKFETYGHTELNS